MLPRVRSRFMPERPPEIFLTGKAPNRPPSPLCGGPHPPFFFLAPAGKIPGPPPQKAAKPRSPRFLRPVWRCPPAVPRPHGNPRKTRTPATAGGIFPPAPPAPVPLWVEFAAGPLGGTPPTGGPTNGGPGEFPSPALVPGALNNKIPPIPLKPAGPPKRAG